MNQQDYFILWSVYCVAALILLCAAIFFTNFLWRWLKESIVLVVAILLFSPIQIVPEATQYAPAIAVLAMDLIMKLGDHSEQILNDFTQRIEWALALYFGYVILVRFPIEYIVRKWWQRRKAMASQQVQDPQNIKEMQDAEVVEEHIEEEPLFEEVTPKDRDTIQKQTEDMEGYYMLPKEESQT